MNEESITRYITGTFDDVTTFTAEDGNTFFFYDPEQKFPFATLVTSDAYDQHSDLERPSIFRLNIGISKESFRARFAPFSSPEESDYDFTALDRLMPHPVYGRMYWVCILNPSDSTWEEDVRSLLAEAYEKDVARHTRRAARHP